MAGTGREPFNVTSARTTPTAATKSPWHSPVPYLFGGLAAMLGLIAFALLILACSYWKLSGYLENENGERDLEAGDGENNKNGEKQGVVFEEKILVIMAGQVKPTFLATPMSSRSSSFGDDNKSNNNNKTCCCGEKGDKFEDGTSVEFVKQQQQRSSTAGDNSETQDSSHSHQTN